MRRVLESRPDYTSTNIGVRPSLNARSHILTINLEDYFQLAPMSGAIPQRYWSRFETRVEANTLAALDLLDEYGHKAVFFTVASLADQIPDVLREVVRRGHEIGSKGFYHRGLSQMVPETFRADAVRSRIALENNCGKTVAGYRIARGWFCERDLWALDILAEEGFEYDSSLRPFGFATSQIPDHATLYRHQGAKKSIWELPLSAWRVGPLSLPISGGNYTRQLPDAFMRQRVVDWVQGTDKPLTFYFHVWELDPDQPRISGISRLNQLRQYRNLAAMPQRIKYYLQTYNFVSPTQYLKIPVRDAPLTTKSDACIATSVALKTVKDCNPVTLPVTLVVPCYNEESNLSYLSNTLTRFVETFADRFIFSFVFVDDGSKDRTREKLHEIFGNRPNTKIVSHAQNLGIAAATMTGIKAASSEIVCVLDADCSYDPAQFAAMIPMLADDVDLVTASPYHPAGGVVNVPQWRLLLSRGVSKLYRTMLNNQLATYTACVRVYRRSSVADLKVESGGYLGITEILVRLDQAGSRVVECPAVLEARVFGISKMKVCKTIWGHLGLLSRLFARRLAFVIGHRQAVTTRAFPNARSTGL